MVSAPQSCASQFNLASISLLNNFFSVKMFCVCVCIKSFHVNVTKENFCFFRD